MSLGLNTRKRAALLKKHGFSKSRFAVTRHGICYEHAGGLRITIPKRANPGANFIALGNGPFSFTSSLLFIGNTAENAKRQVQYWRDSGFEFPDPYAEDFGEPEWIDALFVGVVTYGTMGQPELLAIVEAHQMKGAMTCGECGEVASPEDEPTPDRPVTVWCECGEGWVVSMESNDY